MKSLLTNLFIVLLWFIWLSEHKIKEFEIIPVTDVFGIESKINDEKQWNTKVSF